MTTVGLGNPPVVWGLRLLAVAILLLSLAIVPAHGAPDPPIITGTDPDSPANNRHPRVKGSVGAGTDSVQIYDDAGCTSMIGQDTADVFTSTGVQVAVADDATTILYSTGLGVGLSNCSAGFPYSERSTPVITGTDPDAPANNNLPRVKGTVAPGTDFVQIYDDAGCTNQIGQDTADVFISTGVQVTVPDDAITILYATSTALGDGLSACAAGFPYTERSTPVITGTDPTSPANQNTVRVKGTVGVGTDSVQIYDDAGCTNMIGQDTANVFASTGIEVSVLDNTTTFFYATALGQTLSGCSQGFAFTEDSTMPGTPVILGSTPASPSSDTNPEVFGTAEAGSIVRLFTAADCSGTPVGSGNAVDFASPGVTILVAPGTSLTVHASATDPAGNVSACSAPFTYTAAAGAYDFAGFLSPVDNPEKVNVATAGRAVPFKWRISRSGIPITDPSSFVSLTSRKVDCGTNVPRSAEFLESFAGTAGLQNLGNGTWQLNVVTSRSYAGVGGPCRIFTLTLDDGTTREAWFRFR